MLIYDLLAFMKDSKCEYEDIINSSKFDLGDIEIAYSLSKKSKDEFYELPHKICLFEVSGDEHDPIEKYFVLVKDVNESISAKCFFKSRKEGFIFTDYEMFVDKKTGEVFHISLKKQSLISLIKTPYINNIGYASSPLHLVRKQYKSSCDKELLLHSQELSLLEIQYDLIRKDSEVIDSERLLAQVVIKIVLSSIEIFSCSNVHIQKNEIKNSCVDQVENKADLPEFSYHTVHIGRKNGYLVNKESQHHRSPRLHLRRGHIRVLQSGVKVWVTSCVVGNKDNGIVISDYKIAV